MAIALDIALFLGIALLCWRGYYGKGLWLLYANQFMQRLLHGKGFWGQLVSSAPLVVGWLLLCHRVNTAGWHASAAGGILLAMTVGLDAMRKLEERQKVEKSSCGK